VGGDLTGGEQFQSFLDLFSNLCNSLPNSDTFILGDFNVNLLQYPNVRSVSDFVDLLFSYGFLQNILFPTRVSPASSSLIDHIITNSNFTNRKSFIITTDISDHYPVIFHVNQSKETTPKPVLFSRDFSQKNKNNFGMALRQLTWNDVTSCQDTNTAYSIFEDQFNDLFNIFFPLKESKLNRRINPLEQWMTIGLLTSRNTKLKLFQTYKKILQISIRIVTKSIATYLIELSEQQKNSIMKKCSKSLNLTSNKLGPF